MPDIDPREELMSDSEERFERIAQEEPKPVDPNERYNTGYIVGLTKDGHLTFELFGSSKGLTELLGLHYHAGQKIQKMYDRVERQGNSLLVGMANALVQLNEKLDRVVKSLPKNQL